MLNTLEIAWPIPVLLMAGVDTGGEDAEEVEAEVVQVTMPTWGGILKDLVGGGGALLFLLLFVQQLMLTGDEYSH